MQQGGIGPQGLALLQAALKMGPQAQAGAAQPGVGLDSLKTGLLSQVFDPANPGGKDGILAMLRNMGRSPGGVPMSPGAPMSLAPPPIPDMNNVGPQLPMMPTATTGTGLW